MTKFERYISIFHFFTRSIYHIINGYSILELSPKVHVMNMMSILEWLFCGTEFWQRWHLYIGLLFSILTSLWLLGPNVFCYQLFLFQSIPVCICTPHMCNAFNWGWMATTPKLDFYDQWPSMNLLRKLPQKFGTSTIVMLQQLNLPYCWGIYLFVSNSIALTR